MSKKNIMLSLNFLCEKYGGELKICDSEVSFSSVSTDTRTIGMGDIFIALVGPNHDGHTYLEVAARQGAVGAIVEKLNPNIKLAQWVVADSYIALADCAREKRQKFEGTVIAVTGSAGKTSVKGMVTNILSRTKKTLSTYGNLNNHIGVPLTVMRASNDEMFMVVEAGASRGGDIRYLTDIIRPDIALVTNVLAAHVEGFGSLDKIAEEKSQIYSCLDENGLAIVNAQSDYCEVFKRRAISSNSNVKIVSFSFDKKKGAQCHAENVELNDLGKAVFTLCLKERRIQVQLGVIGKHHVVNALSAALVADGCGIPLETIKKGLAEYSGDKGRMQPLKITDNLTLIDDTYNANPGSVASAINYLADVGMNGRSTFLVLGDMGELGGLTIQAHKDVGLLAKRKKITGLLTVGSLAKHASDAFGQGAEWFENKAALADRLRSQVFAHSILLFKGSRSAKMEQVVEIICTQSTNKLKVTV